MGKAEKERLSQALASQLDNVHQTLQVLEQTPASSLEKLSWDEVIKMGEQLSKQATTAGMLWTGEKPELKALEESMEGYFNILQGLLLLAYGGTVGAGPTLSSNIHASVKQVVDRSFVLWKESVASYGSRSSKQKLTIPQIVGTVWDACSALKRTPATNITAVGRAMMQVAVSIKDVSREMKELRPCSSNLADDAAEKSSSQPRNQSDDADELILDDLGKDLSPEEMKIVEQAAGVVSELLAVIKELVRSITGLLKQGNMRDSGDDVDSLEKLLKLCRDTGVEVDELGACLYPPQESSAIIAASEKISGIVEGGGVGCHQRLDNSFPSSMLCLEERFG
ncbi:hypothetical protein Dimus_031432 [Dionaea muscipula]